MARHEPGEVLVERKCGDRVGCGATPQLGGPRLERRAIGSLGSVGRRGDQLGAHEDVNGDVLARLEALHEVAPPRLEVVGPGHDRVDVAADVMDGELGPPSIVAERGHRHLAPAAHCGPAMQEHRRDDVVPIDEHVGLDDDAGRDVLDDRATPALDARHPPIRPRFPLL